MSQFARIIKRESIFVLDDPFCSCKKRRLYFYLSYFVLKPRKNYCIHIISIDDLKSSGFCLGITLFRSGSRSGSSRSKFITPASCVADPNDLDRIRVQTRPKGLPIKACVGPVQFYTIRIRIHKAPGQIGYGSNHHTDHQNVRSISLRDGSEPGSSM